MLRWKESFDHNKLTSKMLPSFATNLKAEFSIPIHRLILQTRAII